jgi:xylulokinase
MFLGIDVGTSEVKVLLLNEAHKVIGVSGSSLEISRPHAGHSEQDPAAWWTATQIALAELKRTFTNEYAVIKAIGLSGQMHGAVLLDANNQVLRPAILWNDTRSAKECVEMMAALPALPQIAGSLAMPGFTAPKLRWLAKHEPAVFAKIAKVILPKDYIRFMLTGEHVCDMSDASGSMWLDVEKRVWSQDLLKLTGLTEAQMPRLVEGSTPSGNLMQHTAAALGLQAGIVVAGGAGDNASSAVGMGAVNAGEGFLSLGTSGVLFVVTPKYQPNAASATHAFCHAVPGRWHQMSVMLSAASCLQWVTKLLGANSEAALEAQASGLSAAQRASAPLFLPYLSGERTPHNDAVTRGSFHELSNDTDAAALAYAVIEGVSFGLADGMRALQAAGCDVKQLSLVGGGARSALWAQQLATLLNINIVTHEESSAGGALGAARLGWLATGAAVADVCLAPKISNTYKPDHEELKILAPRYERFRAIYPALKAIQKSELIKYSK